MPTVLPQLRPVDLCHESLRNSCTTSRHSLAGRLGKHVVHVLRHSLRHDHFINRRGDWQGWGTDESGDSSFEKGPKKSTGENHKMKVIALKIGTSISCQPIAKPMISTGTRIAAFSALNHDYRKVDMMRYYGLCAAALKQSQPTQHRTARGKRTLKHFQFSPTSYLKQLRTFPLAQNESFVFVLWNACMTLSSESRKECEEKPKSRRDVVMSRRDVANLRPTCGATATYETKAVVSLKNLKNKQKNEAFRLVKSVISQLIACTTSCTSAYSFSSLLRLRSLHEFSTFFTLAFGCRAAGADGEVSKDVEARVSPPVWRLN